MHHFGGKTGCWKRMFFWQEYCLLLGWDNASSAFDCRRRLEVENCHERWSEEKDIYLFLYKRQAMLRNVKFPPYYPILSVLFRFTSHFHYFKWKTKMWANSFVMIKMCSFSSCSTLLFFIFVHILHLHICLCNCFEHIHWSQSIVTIVIIIKYHLFWQLWHNCDNCRHVHSLTCHLQSP